MNELLEEAVRLGAQAADLPVINAHYGATGAERTRIAIDAALRALLDNGMITLHPRPETFYFDRWRLGPEGGTP